MLNYIGYPIIYTVVLRALASVEEQIQGPVPDSLSQKCCESDPAAYPVTSSTRATDVNQV